MLSAQSGLRGGYVTLARDAVAQATKPAEKQAKKQAKKQGRTATPRSGLRALSGGETSRRRSATDYGSARIADPPSPRQGEIEWPPALRERGLLCFSRCVRIAPVALATRSSRKDDHHEARSRNAWPRSLFVVSPPSLCAAAGAGAAGSLSRGPAAAAARRCDRHRAGKSAAAAGRAQPGLQRRLQRGVAHAAVERRVLEHRRGPLVRRQGRAVPGGHQPGLNRWDAQLRHQHIKLQKGHTYTVQFKVRSTQKTRTYLKLGQAGPPYREFWKLLFDADEKTAGVLGHVHDDLRRRSRRRDGVPHRRPAGAA